jgi:CubicO group peptidase (beta-lactamase class C family)
MRQLNRRLALLWIAGAALAASVQAQVGELPRARPEAVGMSSERLARLSAVLRADVESKRLPGAVLLIARNGKVVQYEAVGKLDPAGDVPMTTDAIFRLYSMSKPVTSVAAMMLVEEGKLKLDDPVSNYIPGFATLQVGVEKPDPAGSGKPVLELVPARRPISVQDLMRHTSGLTYGFFGNSLVKTAYSEADLLSGDPSSEAFVERLTKLPLAYQPGTTWDYSHSTDVLGRIVEVVSGQSLYRFEKERVLDPLGMRDTAFFVADPNQFKRVAEPFGHDRNFGLNANFGDPRRPLRWESGGGGMVGTAMDYARFAQMLLNGGSYDGRRLLSPKTVSFMTSDHLGSQIATTPLYIPGPGYGFGLGFAVRRVTGESTYPAEPGSFHWGGAGGTYFWVDPKSSLVVVFMMQSPRQRVYYRTLLHDMVYAAIIQ